MPIHITLEKIGLLTCVIINMSIVFNYSKIWTTVNIFLQKEEPNLLLRQLKKNGENTGCPPPLTFSFYCMRWVLLSCCTNKPMKAYSLCWDAVFAASGMGLGWMGETAAILLTLRRPCPKFEQEVKPLSTLPYLFLTFAFFLM